MSKLKVAMDRTRDAMTGQAGVDPWENSPHRWLRELQSRARGKAGEQIIASWLGSEGFTVGSPFSTDADRSVSLHEVEIKLSTQWATGEYVFQQIRDQNYRFVILLGVSPENIHVWVLPKRVALKFSTPQHMGRDGAETRWLSIPVDNPPLWLSRYGGAAEKGLEAIKTYLGRGKIPVGLDTVPMINESSDREWLLEQVSR